MLLLIPANRQSVVHQNIQTVSSYNGQLGTGSTGKATTPQEPFEPLRGCVTNLLDRSVMPARWCTQSLPQLRERIGLAVTHPLKRVYQPSVGHSSKASTGFFQSVRTGTKPVHSVIEQ